MTRVLYGNHRGVICMLQGGLEGYYRGVTWMLYVVTRVFKAGYKVVTVVLQRCDIGVTVVLGKGLTYFIFDRGFFPPCSKLIYMAQGSPKTYFVFTLNSVFHILSKLFDHQDLTSYLSKWSDC